MGFAVLGALEVVDDDGRVVEIAGGQTRAVLALLLAAEGRVVSAEALIDALWGASPPASATGTLQSYISRLRRALEPERAAGSPARVLVSAGDGYRLDVAPEAVDFRRFEALADEGADLLRAGDAAAARERLQAAERLWRGPALSDCPDGDLTRGLAARLEERRGVAVEDRVEADLALGRHDALVGELTELVRRHPLRERLRAQLALALYRAGRQAEALRALADARRTLVDELGVDPGPALQELEAKILDHDPSLQVRMPADAVAPPTGATAPPTRPRRGEGETSTGFVGRRNELAQLLQSFDESREGARFVVLEGQPGIGKTRLAEEVAGWAAARGAAVLWGRSLEGDAAPAFWPWLSVLRPLALAASEVGPRLGQMLGLHEDPVDPGGAARFELFEEVAVLLAAAAGPVLVLDDVQWADPASLELLAFLATRLQDEPLLLLATVRELELGRSDGVVDALAAIARRPGSRRLRLRGLTSEDTGELLRQATGHDVPPPVATAIHQRAEGNPFYATELAQLLADVEDLSDPAAIARAAVPTSVRDVVRQRLSRLPAPTVDLLQICAVVGREAEVATVAAVSGAALVDCLDQLEAAVRHRLIVEVDERPGTFSFAHALVREVVLDDLSSLRRARLHLGVADAVEATSGGSDDVAEILAEHLWAASAVGVGRRAAAALHVAGQVAVRRLGYESGEDLLSRALQLRRATGTSPEDQREELAVLVDLLSLRRSRQGYASLADDPELDAAIRLADQLEDDDAQLGTLYMQWSAYDTACRYREGTATAARILDVGGEREEPHIQHFVHQVQGIHAWHLGRISDARDHLDLAASVAPQPEITSLLAISSEMWMLANAFATYIHDLAGDLSLADVDRRFEELARSVQDPFLLSLITTFAAAGGVVGGDPARAVRWGEQTLVVDQGLDFAFWNGTSRAYLGAALVDLDRTDEGLPILRAGAQHCVDHGIRTNHGTFVAIQAMGEAMQGDLAAARASIDHANEEQESHGERWPRPIILEAEAVLAAAAHEPATRVAELLHQAADEAVAQGSLGILRRLRRTAERLGAPVPTTGAAPVD